MVTDDFIAQLILAAYHDETFRVHDLEVLVTETSRCLIVTVRGTEVTEDFSLMDVVRDLRCVPLYDRDSGLGHAGMTMGANLVASKLDRRLRKRPDGRDIPIVLGGHSLGAGVSLLMVPDLIRRGYNVVRWVGLGTPRVAWVPSSDWRCRDVRMTAYKYGRDIVTYLPPKWLGYRLPDGVEEVTIGTPARRWPNVTDHQVVRYVTEIQKTVAGRENNIA